MGGCWVLEDGDGRVVFVLGQEAATATVVAWRGAGGWSFSDSGGALAAAGGLGDD